MKWNVFYTEQAENDLRSIYEYIAYSLFVPATAKKQTKAIMDEVSALETIPFRYPVYNREPWKSKGLRYFPVNNYLVFYLTVEEKNTVVIVRIMYGGRNIEEQLSENI